MKKLTVFIVALLCVVAVLRAADLQFTSSKALEQPKVLVTIYQDGRVEYNGPVTDAARAFWNEVKRQSPHGYCFTEGK